MSLTQKIVSVDGANVLMATVPRTDGQSGNGDIEGIYLMDGESGEPVSITPNGTAGANAVCAHRIDGTPIAGDGTDATGVSAPTGATGIRGWLSGIYKLLQGTLGVALSAALPAGSNNIGSVNVANTPSVSLTGCSYASITDAAVHTITATRYVGIRNLSSTAQSPTVTVCDGTNMSAQVIDGPAALGAAETLTSPLGGVDLTSGKISVQCSAIPGGNGILVLYIP